MLRDLPNRLRKQAINVTASGHLTAARLMEEAAHEIETHRGTLDRPENCRNRIRDEGINPYPKSGCAYCKTGGLTGCPFEDKYETDNKY